VRCDRRHGARDGTAQSIRKQATDLRYIFEAPKLKIGDDERVSIPDLSDVDALAYATSLAKFPDAPSRPPHHCVLHRTTPAWSWRRLSLGVSGERWAPPCHIGDLTSVQWSTTPHGVV
jgi:hypothetical protein